MEVVLVFLELAFDQFSKNWLSRIMNNSALQVLPSQGLEGDEGGVD